MSNYFDLLFTAYILAYTFLRRFILMCSVVASEKIVCTSAVLIADQHRKPGEEPPRDDDFRQRQPASTDEETGRQTQHSKSVVVTVETTVMSVDAV